jgi:hypothetical protein
MEPFSDRRLGYTLLADEVLDGILFVEGERAIAVSKKFAILVTFRLSI